MTITINLKEAEEGGFTVTCKEHPGIFTQGETVFECLENFVDAFKCYYFDEFPRDRHP